MIKLIYHILPVLLISLLFLVVVKSFSIAFVTKKTSLKKCKLQSFVMILAHIQLILGIMLFCDFAFSEPPWQDILSNKETRKNYIERPIALIIAVFLISIGKVKAKKNEDSVISARIIFIYFIIALGILLFRMPFDKLLVI